jgi:hypothetical protein
VITAGEKIPLTTRGAFDESLDSGVGVAKPSPPFSRSRCGKLENRLIRK